MIYHKRSFRFATSLLLSRLLLSWLQVSWMLFSPLQVLFFNAIGILTFIAFSL